LKSEVLSRNARLNVLKMIYQSKGSHIGSALSVIDILSVLYNGVLNVNPKYPDYKNRDRFILSKGHACVGLYAVLAECGFISKKLLEEYGDNSSILMNHASHKVCGVEHSTGALGHGLPVGVGKALVAKMNNFRWKTFVLLSDGEMQEGSNWEAIMFAAHHNLDNIVAIIDYNNLQSLDSVDKTLNINPLNKKFTSFGWNVEEIEGHNHEGLKETLTLLKNQKGAPSVVIAHTIKGKGVTYMENNIKWHYKTPSYQEYIEAINEIKSA
tara:strand:+ start:221 stop:1024 length:804 start_codon:yes stop_codon:yes gene_type:complete